MLFALSLSFVLIAVSIPAAVTQREWDDVYNSCGPPGSTTIGGAALVSDVVNMGKAAGGFMDKLEAGQLAPWDVYRVASMFDTVFDAEQPDAKDRWDTVRANLHIMENIATIATQQKIWISCDDTTIFGVEIVDNTPRQFFTNPYTKEKVYMEPKVRQCSDSPVLNGITLHSLGYREKIRGTEYVIVCANQHESRP